MRLKNSQPRPTGKDQLVDRRATIGYNSPWSRRAWRAVAINLLSFIRRRHHMAVSVKKVTLWRTEVENKPGTLSAVLTPLAAVGADLQVVMGYRYPDEVNKAAIEVCTISGKKPTTAAIKAGLSASTIPTLLVHGDNHPGVGHAIAESVAEAGINVMFLVAQVVDTRFSAVIGFEDEPASEQAVAIIKKAIKKLEKHAAAAAPK
jgi:hypothetical protein